jgi:Truncated, possibly inactive, lysyl-tRNA synthetase (class II)
MLRAIRAHFDADGFIEVETPVRIPAPANEPHIIPPASGGQFLRASPELQMKRLLALGFKKLCQIGPCFRQGERGALHNPEFTMLEWYRAGADYMALFADLKSFVCAAAEAVCGARAISFRGAEIDLARGWEKITVREAFKMHAGWDPIADFDQARFDHDMALKVEPNLPKDRPLILLDYPAPAASLSRLSPSDSRVAERWEAYIGGVEICNAFGELTDAAEQRRRFEQARAEKLALNEPPLPLDEDFLASLPAMPPASGAALGIDRLALILLDAPAISAVRAFCEP